VQRDLREEFSKEEEISDWYDRTEEALAKAINFLRSEGVQHISLMPYTFPIPVLAAFFHLHPEPNPWVLRLLAHWLWRSWVNGERSQTPALRKAVNAVNPKRLDPDKAPQEYEAVKNLLTDASDTPVTSVNLSSFRADKAQGRMILLALASLTPRRPSGTIVDLAAQFERYGNGAVAELIKGHRSDAAARAFWPSDDRPFSGDEALDVLMSHAIDRVAAARYRAGDTDGFLQRRGELIEPMVKDFLNSRLETGALVRPPLEDLIITDNTE
jgi:hypothetical protein